MNFRQKAERLLYSLRRTVGVRPPAQAVAYLLDRASRSRGTGQYASEPLIGQHPFDAQYGTQTSGLIESSPEAPERHAYYGVSPSVFRATCRRWQESLAPGTAIEDYTFIDLGAGMGRALLLASELPFRKVVGVEIDSSLIPIARRNFETWSATQQALCPVEILEVDARSFTLPRGPLLIFLYNPFGEKIVEEAIRQMLKHEQMVDVLYIYPIFGWLFERHRAFRLSWMKLIPLDPDDAAADAFRGTSETCAAYRKG